MSVCVIRKYRGIDGAEKDEDRKCVQKKAGGKKVGN